MEVIGMVKSISRSFLLQFRNVAPERTRAVPLAACDKIGNRKSENLS